MNIDDQTLMAYADDELDAATRAQVEAALARDPALAARVEEHRALRAELNAAFDPVLDEPVPDRLLAAVKPPVRGDSAPIDLASVRQRRAAKTAGRRRFPSWAAIAASLLIGILVGRVSLNSGAVLTTRDGEVFAAGELAAALNDRLSSEDSEGTRIAFSFRTSDGQYCRAFNRAGTQSLAGVACHETEGWKVRAVATVEQSSSEYRMAGAEIPAAVGAAVEDAMHGEPLTVDAEEAARTNGWR